MTQHPPLILIVDDSPTQAALLEDLLTGSGYRVDTARNGSAALKSLLQRPPHLVISDVMMPEMDGFELCRRIRATPSLARTPIILLTQLDDPADLLHSLEAGADFFVSKPYTPSLLLDRVACALSGERTPGESEPEQAVELSYRGRSYRIGASRARTVEHLLATYELAVEKNQELQSAKESLSTLNRELERRVRQRTEALTAETAQKLQAIVELRKKDEALIQQSRQAAMGEMIGNIAHQWRQPLNAVALLVQDLKLCHQYGEFSREYLESSTGKMMQIIRHMSQTIDDFRNFFMPDREKTLFELERVVRRTLTLVEGTLADRGILVEVEARQSPAVLGYPNEFSQVLLNIINNAIDAFGEQGCQEPRLTVRVFADAGRSVVAIADNAGGIAEPVMGRIFEPYFTTKEPGKGTGIGLFMAKNIVEKSMNGSLSARNTGAGAEFRIEV